MKTWTGTVITTYQQTVSVTACTEQEAIEKMQSAFDPRQASGEMEVTDIKGEVT